MSNMYEVGKGVVVAGSATTITTGGITYTAWHDAVHSGEVHKALHFAAKPLRQPPLVHLCVNDSSHLAGPAMAPYGDLGCPAATA